MGRLARGSRLLLAYALPAYLALVLTIAVQGALAPWAPARDALARHPGQLAITVGVAMTARRVPGRGLETSKSRYYVLVPGVLRQPRLLRVTQVDGGPAGVSYSRSGFWWLLGAVLTCVVGSIWAWRPSKMH